MFQYEKLKNTIAYHSFVILANKKPHQQMLAGRLIIVNMVYYLMVRKGSWSPEKYDGK